MRVMLGSVTSPLWCEAIPENIDYLRACVCEQTKAEKSSCMSDRARDRDPMFDCAAPGVTWVPSRSAFRLRYKDKDTGLMKYKDFRADANDAQSVCDASAKAAAFRGERIGE